VPELAVDEAAFGVDGGGYGLPGGDLGGRPDAGHIAAADR